MTLLNTLSHKITAAIESKLSEKFAADSSDLLIAVLIHNLVASEDALIKNPFEASLKDIEG